MLPYRKGSSAPTEQKGEYVRLLPALRNAWTMQATAMKGFKPRYKSLTKQMVLEAEKAQCSPCRTAWLKAHNMI